MNLPFHIFKKYIFLGNSKPIGKQDIQDPAVIRECSQDAELHVRLAGSWQLEGQKEQELGTLVKGNTEHQR